MRLTQRNILLTIFIIILAITISLTYWRIWDSGQASNQNTPKEVQQTSSQGEKQKQNENSNSDASITDIAGDDQLIEDSAKQYCQNNVDKNNVPFSFIIGTIGPESKKILFSKDRQFASINVHCAPKEETGGGIGYILKKINNRWTVIVSGTQDINNANEYDIPSDFN